MDAYQRWDISLKGIALFGAGVFFAYQVLAGSYEVATSLSLAAAPMKCEGKVCALVTTKLERGANWSAYVEKAELTVVEDGKRHNPISIQYKHPSRDTFELAPGEKTEYGTIVPDCHPASQLSLKRFLCYNKKHGLVRTPTTFLQALQFRHQTTRSNNRSTEIAARHW